MLLELFAVIMAGLGGAGVMMLLSKLSGNRLPRWIVPVAAGAAMLIAAISSEYSWYGRTAKKARTDGLVIAQTSEDRALWRPWSYLFPLTLRFAAVDKKNMLRNEKAEGLFLVNVVYFARWGRTEIVQFMVDCAGNRRADPVLGDGSDPLWRDVGPDDPVVKTVCAGV